MKSTRIVPFDASYLPAFVQLNRQWIETHFEIEPMDLAQLENPYESILKPGGEILFLLEMVVSESVAREEAVGTVALVPHGPGCFEVAKMAVAPSARGNGYGDLLMAAAIDRAKARAADRLMLLSNTILAPAIALYHKHGFKTIHLGAHPDYKRCNIEMELAL